MNGLVMNGPEKYWFCCSVLIGLEKCFLWFCGAAMIGGFEKCYFQWFAVNGPGKAYF